ncbi:MAG: hypothetical protein DRR06_00525 [Gammaproteobacteria bacterium]|nr:MAG: hypothetical protein DRR06_00525 [Gammaproteobacteria bacterium]RLA50111.1 MAG: hypothetical protein DRR42_14010 [Gammaproteobacteria bacterium]
MNRRRIIFIAIIFIAIIFALIILGETGREKKTTIVRSEAEEICASSILGMRDFVLRYQENRISVKLGENPEVMRTWIIGAEVELNKIGEESLQCSFHIVSQNMASIRDYQSAITSFRIAHSYTELIGGEMDSKSTYSTLLDLIDLEFEKIATITEKLTTLIRISNENGSRR